MGKYCYCTNRIYLIKFQEKKRTHTQQKGQNETPRNAQAHIDDCRITNGDECRRTFIPFLAFNSLNNNNEKTKTIYL